MSIDETGRESLASWDEVDDEAAGEATTDETGDQAPPQDVEDVEEEPGLYLGSVDEFVREIVVPTFRRRVGDRSPYRWAAKWWAYPEATLRLEAMWRAWEHLRLDPSTGISVWLRDHADPHLAVLMSEHGPFGRSEDTSQLGDPLPYEAPPEGMFPDQRQP